MNCLIAKIRSRSKEPIYKKLLAGLSLFELPSNLGQHIQYSPDHNPDEDSWFGIENFSEKTFCLEFLKTPFSSAEYDTLNIIHVDKLDYLCSYQNENEYFFQKVYKTQFINKKLITFGDEIKYQENNKLITIRTEADAIYMKDRDILYFKNLPTISSVFKGIDSLYREATEFETTEFLHRDFIQLNEGFSAGEVGKLNRRRIAMAIDTLNGFREDEKNTVLDYIQDYCPDLERENNAFKIKSDNELKKLLYGIEQRYYTTLVGRERRCANSIIRLAQ